MLSKTNISTFSGRAHSPAHRASVNTSDFFSRKPNLDSDFNRRFFDEKKNSNGLTAYTFIYRFQHENDFTWTDFGPYCHPTVTLQHTGDNFKKYLIKITASNIHIRFRETERIHEIRHGTT